MQTKHATDCSEKIVSTWLYLEDFDEFGIYPQVRGKSNTYRFHDIYKRCLVTFFLSAKFANPDSKLMLFSNVHLEKCTRTFDKKIFAVLENLGVTNVQLDYSFRPPMGQRLWRNQFYVLDILNYLSNFMKDSDACLIMDGDIIWSGSKQTTNLWVDLMEYGSLNMVPIADKSERINGFSLSELSAIYYSLTGETFDIEYAGGELIALRGDKVKQVIHLAGEFKLKYDNLRLQKNLPYIEEAHLLSWVYSFMRMKFGTADKYIKRIWTQKLIYSNLESSDLNLTCWHLPAEKRYGIRRLASRILKNPSFKWPNHGSNEWYRLANELGIQDRNFKKFILDFGTAIQNRILN